ncbi:MAG: hypothetical protein IT539_10960 [Bradyrhizobiaceae bacterium]|nr:hypothetical protein [Bradyrhizobiaceae bacterium]
MSASSVVVAAPLGSGQLALKNAAASDVVDVSWRGRRNTAVALGVLGGLALGGAIAHGHYYSPSPYYYAAPPPPPPQRCWVQTGPYRGQGYWAYC